MRKSKAIISAVLVLALSALVLMGAAGEGPFVSGSDVANGTIQGADLGDGVTYVKAATLTVPASTLDCPDDEDACFGQPGAAVARVRCGSGNVASGSLHTDAVTDPTYLVQSYPVNDSTWLFEVENESDDAAVAKLRVVCL
jgi:hypothetical protein